MANTPLKQFLTGYSVGKTLSVEEFRSRVTTKNTSCYYLTAEMVQYGFVQWKSLIHLSSLEGSEIGHLAHTKDILIPKNGNRNLCALIDGESVGKNILVSDEFYILHVNDETSDPFFLKAVFSSRTGMELFTASTSDDEQHTLNIEKLLEMEIPENTVYYRSSIAEDYLSVYTRSKSVNSLFVREQAAEYGILDKYLGVPEQYLVEDGKMDEQS